MSTKRTTSFTQSNLFRIAVTTAVILLIPFLAMQFTDEVKWDGRDFLTIGVLVFGAGLAYELITKTVGKAHRVAIGLAIVAALLWLWVELAVGLFTNWGS